jgi:hypothetical protein
MDLAEALITNTVDIIRTITPAAISTYFFIRTPLKIFLLKYFSKRPLAGAQRHKENKEGLRMPILYLPFVNFASWCLCEK